MARKFAEITFTAAVKEAQVRYGSRSANEGFEYAEDKRDTLGEAEIAFINERDGFYQATVNENDWPYVQFRGGPAGFLKVLDERTIGYADFRGNIQYLSVGNLAANNRVSLILMDYPNRRRLKIWARARIVHHDEDADLLARLEVSTYRARVERAVVLTVEAVDWNCPQHITPRFSESEIDEMVAPLRHRIAELEATAGDLPAAQQKVKPVIGEGPLELVITGIRQLTPEVRAYELRHPEFEELPRATPGSHIQVPVSLADGSLETRSYSIASNPDRRDAYEIAVRLDPEGCGGSRAVHDIYTLGLHIRAGLPKNAFSLHDDSRPSILIAGGIGITPLKSMVEALKAEGRAFQLHYAARSRGHLAYREQLSSILDGAVTYYATDQGDRIDIDTVLAGAEPDAVFYVCGPQRLIEAVHLSADALGIDRKRVRFERFSAAKPEGDDTTFEVRLAQSSTKLTIARDQSLLDALLDADIKIGYGCKSGTCGTCATKVLEGEVEHRDMALSKAEQNQAGLMCVCVSRAASDCLVLDL